MQRLLGMMAGSIVMFMGLTGCSDICDVYCESTVNKIEAMGCMEEWETSWNAEGYEDSADYLQHCRDVFDAQMKDAKDVSESAVQDIRQNCDDKLDETEAAENCAVMGRAGY